MIDLRCGARRPSSAVAGTINKPLPTVNVGLDALEGQVVTSGAAAPAEVIQSSAV